MSILRRSPALLLVLAASGMVAVAPRVQAKKRFGFQKFPATYTGGYSINAGETNWAGSAKIRIRGPRNGRSATVRWVNTFYNEHGSYRVTLRWTFRPDGTFATNAMDPRVAGRPGSGTFTLDGKRPAAFSATDASGSLHAEGTLRLSGGGSVAISVTLTGVPDGPVTCGFTGSRNQTYR